MPYVSESQTTDDRLLREAGVLQAIARRHGLPIGSPERLQAFPLRLSQDGALRSELASFVRALQRNDPELSLPDVLSLLVEVIGGSPARGRDRSLEEPIDLIGGFLASIGGWAGAEAEPITDLDNPPDHDPRLDLREAEDERHDLPAAPRVGVAPAMADEDAGEFGEEAGGAAQEVALAEVVRALERLERGNVELRFHLDSIDQRISRMEPLIEALPQNTPPAAKGRAEADDTHLPATSADPATSSRVRGREPMRSVVEREADLSLVHRAAASAAPADAVDPQVMADPVGRRISLTATGLPASERMATSTRPAVVTSQGNGSAGNGVSSLPGAMHDPSSRPRLREPRRDRFAAAREMPGVLPEADPLYNEPDDMTPLSEVRASAVPASFSAERAGGVGVLEAEEERRPAAKIAPAEPAEAAAGPRRPVAGPTFALQAVAEQPDAQVNTQPATRPARSATSLFGSYSEDGAVEPVQPRRRKLGVSIASFAVAVVVGAAAEVYFNGVPQPVQDWLSGGSSTAASSATARPQTPAEAGSAAPSLGRRQGAGTSSMMPPSAIRRTGDRRQDAGEEPVVTADGKVLGAREAFTPRASTESIPPPTFVPGPVMEGRLLEAPRPAYPDTGAGGRITFEAMISKDGQVEALKALGGSRALRDPAEQAIRQWQYRPYLINGRPVEVRTIVRVDVEPKAGLAPQ